MVKKWRWEKGFYTFMALITALVIFLFSSIPVPVVERTGLNISIIYHIGVFFMFSFFLTLSLKKGMLDKKTIAITLLLSFAYALSDELHQMFVIGRFASVKDVITDSFGSVGAVLILKLISLYRKI